MHQLGQGPTARIAVDIRASTTTNCTEQGLPVLFTVEQFQQYRGTVILDSPVDHGSLVSWSPGIDGGWEWTL